MQHACADLEEEVAELDEQTENVLRDLRRSVADLNGLKVAREKDADEKTRQVVEGALMDLKKFEKTCNDG